MEGRRQWRLGGRKTSDSQKPRRTHLTPPAFSWKAFTPPTDFPGFTTLGALKWLADVGASFVMLNPTGKVLFAIGPTASSDTLLRRVQALAQGNGVELQVSRALIDAKLEG
jgi:hypothetical protein